MPTAAEVEIAYNARRTARIGLVAARAHNQKAREHNRKNRHKPRLGQITVINELTFLPVGREAIPLWAKQTLDREDEDRSLLAQRKPGVWRALLLRLPPAQAAAVAAVVWWDFFAARGGERGPNYRAPWPELDDLIATKPPVLPATVIERGLRQVGYSEWQARRRMAAS